AATAMKFAAVGTSVWPRLSSPQANNAPSACNATVCSAPPATAIIFVANGGMVICPKELSPQAASGSSACNEKLCNSPAARLAGGAVTSAPGSVNGNVHGAMNGLGPITARFGCQKLSGEMALVVVPVPGPDRVQPT